MRGSGRPKPTITQARPSKQSKSKRPMGRANKSKQPTSKRPPHRKTVKWMTCVHEAGHAVVAVAQGWCCRIQYVYVVEDPDTSVRGATLLSQFVPRPCPKYVAYCLGGLEAERVVSRERVEVIAGNGARDDLDDLGSRAVAWTDAGHSHIDVDAALRHGRPLARAVMRRHWSAVIALAEVLAEGEMLGAEEVEEIVCSADPVLAGIVRAQHESSARWLAETLKDIDRE